MNNQTKAQVLEQVKSANNVLVTVSANPTVDELAASVGLTLFLNKMGKHATTVFSGVVPSTIEFLEPEKTIETTTDSLRDFIIALDKSKADKLRYKVEDDVVRIFITPYRSTITEEDLEFSHGDFNVDVVLGLGVVRREDLDKAITAHGRILHDATVVSFTKGEMVSDLGAINWQEPTASSLCEMVTTMAYELQPDGIDGQMATAFLTGIIAETDRFKNNLTTPIVLSLSSQLLAAGANQQLIAEKLEEPTPPPMPLHETMDGDEHSGGGGELAIDHPEDPSELKIDNIHIDEHGNLDLQPAEPAVIDEPTLPEPSNEEQPPAEQPPAEEKEQPAEPAATTGHDLFDELAAQVSSEFADAPQPAAPEEAAPLLSHGKTIEPPKDPNQPEKTDKPFDLQEALQAVAQPDEPPQPVDIPLPAPPAATQPAPESPAGDTLTDLEKAVDSPHVQTDQVVDQLAAAQAAVSQAAAAQPPLFPTPTESVGAQLVEVQEPPKPEQQSDNPPPPVPPPMMPQFYDADGKNTNPFLNPDGK